MKTRVWATGWMLLWVSAGWAGAADWYVATNGNDAADGASWPTAKLTIQEGVDAASDGDTVWVSNGVYATGGGRAVVGTRPNRVSIDKPVAVIGVNGPEETIIVGGGMRGVYVTNGATLSGFTVTNGSTAGGLCGMPETDTVDHKGGGALCADGGMLTNCVLTGNWACWSGGGVHGGLLFNSLLDNNYCANAGGGASGGILESCILTNNVADLTGGGGAWECNLKHCLLSHNSSGSSGGGTLGGDSQYCIFRGNHAAWGGGIAGGSCDNCLLMSNTGSCSGGGGYDSEMRNCTIVGNTTSDEFCYGAGGTYLCRHENCIIYDNTSATGDPNWHEGSFTNCCTTPLPPGAGNVTNAPLFVDAGAGNYRLAAGSPCIGAGDNSAVSDAEDLDGYPRIVNATVDMGAYEYQAAGGIILITLPASTNVECGAAGGLELGVTANVVWTAATNAPWLAITSGASGTTNGTVVFGVAANAGAARTGAVIVAGGGLSRTCAVVQAAFVPALAVSPASTNVGSGAASELALGVAANVAWTAATNAPWLAISSGESGTTNGTVVFGVAANAGAARTGTIVVAGGGLARTCAVVQAAFVPALAVSPAATNVGSGAASGLALGVTANVAWTAATNAPWLAITSGESGTTNGTVIFGVAANAGAARTGTIVVAGGGLARTCAVVQAAFVPALAVSPAATNVGSGAASGLALGVTANVAWTAATNAPWLAISSGESGTTNGTVVFGVAANAGAARTGTIVVAGGGLARTCTVVQVKNPAFTMNWHVATNGNDAAAGTNWATAKLTIQAGVDAASDGDTVWVSNGVYATGGGRAVVGTRANRVSIDKPVAVIGVNGPEETIIVGGGMRGAYVTNGATLSGFTVTNGTTASADGCSYTDGVNNRGGGAYCETNAVLTNCVLTGNWACYAGGGANGGILNDCELIANGCSMLGGGASDGILNRCRLQDNQSDQNGGGAWRSQLADCELVGNLASAGGGAYASTLDCCLLEDNYGGSMGGGALQSTLSRCRVIGNRSIVDGGGGANLCTLYDCLLSGNRAVSGWDEPSGGGAKDSTLVNCTVAGNTAFRGGGVRGGTMINCIVYGNTATNSPNWHDGAFTNSCTTPLPPGSGNVTNAPLFVDAGSGNYRLAAGSPCINAGDNALVEGATDLDGAERIIFGTVDMGAYEFLYQHVAPGGSDAANGMSWATAKQTIQAAVDATTNGCIVLVTNGVYASGGRAVGPGALTNRVAIDRPIAVRSINGPEATVIQGAGPSGNASVRCAYVETNAVLSGFTLTNGMATPDYGADNIDRSGGGVFLAAGGLVEHCLISGNFAKFGAGAYLDSGGRLYGCRMIGNSAGDTGVGGGAYSSGGGRLDNCLMAGNYAEGGPGVWANVVELNNCTVSGNSSFGGPGVVAPTSTIHNCIVFSNNVDTNHFEIEGNPVVVYSCSPGLSGEGNVTNDPQFVDAAAGNYRLLAISPCIDAGNNGVVSWDEDLDGNQRIVYGAVDMGAYEAQLAGAGTWFGAITNGLTGDLDCVAGDGVPNLLKYATGGSPRISDDLMRLGWVLNGGVPTLTFNRNPNATDVRFVVEGADRMENGATWRGLATNVGGSWLGAANVSESGTGNPVVCTVTDPVALETNRFLRLNVTRP
ncbi:MAG: choice-of-anchor Q domain-containing protein [Kiritimatiellia bacterium]